MVIKIMETPRGFKKMIFKDRANVNCFLQKSSLATENAIWFGVNDPNPRIMASQAENFGIKTKETTGWIPYPVPKEVVVNTEMHLTQDMVKALLPTLQKFAETGEI